MWWWSFRPWPILGGPLNRYLATQPWVTLGADRHEPSDDFPSLLTPEIPAVTTFMFHSPSLVGRGKMNL